MFEYCREKIAINRVSLLQETHFCHDTVINWHDNSKAESLFSHGITNSCSVMIGYLGSKK